MDSPYSLQAMTASSEARDESRDSFRTGERDASRAVEAPRRATSSATSPTRRDAHGPVLAPAQSDLYAKFYPRLYGYARKFTDPALAEDIVQEVFLRVLKYKNGDMAALPLQFLLTMTKNVALRMLSDRRRHGTTVSVDASGERSAERPDDVLARASVPGLLERLPDRQREAIVLTEAHGLSEHQAGLAMNSSRSAVSARRRTGLEHLRRVGLGRVEAAGDAHARSSDRSSRSDAPAEHAREQGPAFASLRLAL